MRRLLVANRGEIAARIIETARARGLECVAVRHPLDHRPRHAGLADRIATLSGAHPVAAHLDIAQLVAIARDEGCDAVHPGYGFLSENAAFARAVTDAGLTFVGPRAETIRLMGDKLAAREFAARHGVPVSPSAVVSPEAPDLAEQVARIGYPVLVKAAAGGGGKGMSIVREARALAERAALAASEAQRYFGDPRIYVERFVERPRHVEVQIVGDGSGRVIHLGERDCSIQRRFQKLVEEAPAFGLPAQLREAIVESAVRLASAARYTNAGTVEFIVAPDGSYYFLEMNTRLQVEHRVTEQICGLDLVALQLDIADGAPLPAQAAIRFSGHAIECRVCAEDPERDFMPETGRVARFVVPDAPWALADSGLTAGQTIGTSFDSMLAKIVVHGADRDEAIERMCRALAGTAVLGVTTNVGYLGRVVAHPAFRAGAVHTGFLDEHAPELRPAPADPRVTVETLIAAACAHPSIRPLLFDTPDPYAAMGGWRH